MVVSVTAEAGIVVELRYEQRRSAERVLWEHIRDAESAVAEFRVRVLVCRSCSIIPYIHPM